MGAYWLPITVQNGFQILPPLGSFLVSGLEREPGRRLVGDTVEGSSVILVDRRYSSQDPRLLIVSSLYLPVRLTLLPRCLPTIL